MHTQKIKEANMRASEQILADRWVCSIYLDVETHQYNIGTVCVTLKCLAYKWCSMFFPTSLRKGPRPFRLPEWGLFWEFLVEENASKIILKDMSTKQSMQTI